MVVAQLFAMHYLWHRRLEEKVKELSFLNNTSRRAGALEWQLEVHYVGIHDSDRTNLRKVINGTVAPGISVKSE